MEKIIINSTKDHEDLTIDDLAVVHTSEESYEESCDSELTEEDLQLLQYF